MNTKVQIVSLPLIPVRKEESDKSEMVTQFLFGERVVVGAVSGNWIRLRSLEDGYEGWVDRRMMSGAHTADLSVVRDSVYRVFSPVARIGCKTDTRYLPMGSILHDYDPLKNSFTLEEKEYTVHSGTIKPVGALRREEVVLLASGLLNVPYLWGGRSYMGIDCSGFVQLVYGLCGVFLPRDAQDQAVCGKPVMRTADIVPGDLAFFSNADGRVIHVGICRDKHSLIHASGSVRIDRLDDTGIFRSDAGEYTHRLYGICRFDPVRPLIYAGD